jgi:NUMOD3 motif/HNH endonuclease
VDGKDTKMYHLREKGDDMLRICTKCNKEKELEKFVKQQNYYRYKCKDCWNKERRTGKPNTGRFKKGVSSSPDTQFKKGATSLRKGIPLTEACKKKISDARKGQRSWKKGLSGFPRPTKRKKTRTGYYAKEWIKKVKERDGNKCVECSSTYRVAAHHIKSWKDHPDLRFDVTNGITLCCRCHVKIDGFKKGSVVNIGRKHTEETRRKHSERMKGKIPWNKGTNGIMKAWNKGTKLINGKYVKLEGE